MHLQKAPIVFDKLFGRCREAESKLKEMITEPLGMLEMKHKDAQARIRTCMRIILATIRLGLKVSLSDRRYFVLEPSEERKMTTSFFDLLKKKLNGGKEALMGTLLEYDLKGFEVEFPRYSARQFQKYSRPFEPGGSKS